MNGQKLIDKHKSLDDFAKHHHNKGGQDAHRLIAENWKLLKSHPRNGSAEGMIENEAVDSTYKEILSLLHKRFVP